MAIIIRWIGWDIELDRKERPFILDGGNPIDGESESFIVNDGRKESMMKFYKFDHYGLTTRGEPINVDEYCARMANYRNVHVFLFQNWDKFMLVETKDIDWSCKFHELKLNDYRGLYQFCSYHCYAPYLEQQIKEILN